jgi:hypothetical protein
MMLRLVPGFAGLAANAQKTLWWAGANVYQSNSIINVVD